MATFAEYMARMRITVTSPDRQIHVDLNGDYDPRVAVEPGAYQRYDEARLAHQLARLGHMSWIAAYRGRQEAERASQGLTEREWLAQGEGAPVDAREQRYEEELNKLHCVGTSGQGMLRLCTNGPMSWHVDIVPGTVRALTEAQFVAELESAYRSWSADRDAKTVVLKSQHFDIGVPREWVERMRPLFDAGRR